jgi:hypothetical protein
MSERIIYEKERKKLDFLLEEFYGNIDSVK